MLEENDSIQEKLMDRMADLGSSKGRWIFAIITSTLLFFVVLGVYIFPVMELSTNQEFNSKAVEKNAYLEYRIDTVALPNTYSMHFEFELDPNFADAHSSAYIYIFKDKLPDLSLDAYEGELHDYLKLNSFRNSTINFANEKITIDLAFRNCDTNVFYVVLHNPDDPADAYDDKAVVIDFQVNYDPMLPLIPIFFVLAFIIVLPIAIIRLYVLSQKKKELRVLLTLDLENLSDEDKIKLGIPLTPKPEAQPIPRNMMAGPPMTPGL